ncbi:hypothetical protein PUN4_180095 [Paraburkholderia unamae]|nr:hypothetical protein PUN4_180095 [Paraburkholderia unamae]
MNETDPFPPVALWHLQAQVGEWDGHPAARNPVRHDTGSYLRG